MLLLLCFGEMGLVVHIGCGGLVCVLFGWFWGKRFRVFGGCEFACGLRFAVGCLGWVCQVLSGIDGVD